MKKIRKIFQLFAVIMLAIAGTGCQKNTEPKIAKNGEIYILFTSDIHCGYDKEFGMEGLQQIRRQLEWGAGSIPNEIGGFLQVAGMSYEIDVSIPTPCKANSDNMMTSIEGERRVKNVKINGEPINPAKTYTIASTDYVVLDGGDENTALMDAKVIVEPEKMDTDILIDYISDTLNGEIPDIYSNPYGQGRITILNAE